MCIWLENKTDGGRNIYNNLLIERFSRRCSSNIENNSISWKNNNGQLVGFKMVQRM